jgi:hypothetical protein
MKPNFFLFFISHARKDEEIFKINPTNLFVLDINEQDISHLQNTMQALYA